MKPTPVMVDLNELLAALDDFDEWCFDPPRRGGWVGDPAVFSPADTLSRLKEHIKTAFPQRAKKDCRNCKWNGRCGAQQRYPYDSGVDQPYPYCDGYSEFVPDGCDKCPGFSEVSR